MPLFEYSKWDGSQQFLPQSADKVFDQLSEYLMQYGEHVLRNMDELEDEMPEIVELIQKEGLIEKDREGQWRVTPRGVRRIQDRALDDLFQTFRRDSLGRHDTQEKGEGTVPLEDTRPYVYGDSLANLNLHETLKNAYVRQGGGVPIRLSSEDYVVHETEYQTRCATVVLIDMSGSMGRYGKYYTTKKVALALQANGPGPISTRLAADDRLLHVRQPDERTAALELRSQAGQSCSTAAIHLRFDLDKPPGRVPQHFTNIHAGLRLARSVLARQPAANKQIIVITDGEPTAHIEGREVVLIYPPAEKTAMHTLAEVRNCANAGIRVSSFALIEDYFYLGLVNFVEEMARVSKGVAAYCSTDEIGNLVFDSFIGGRRTRRSGS